MRLDKNKLHNSCNSSIKTLRKLGKFTPTSKNSGYTFIDNNANVLGVAHIDTVQSSRKFSSNSKKVFSPRLDDRLGVYTLLHLLPSLGISLDILLCEDEEIGQSTAQFFETNKQYNWMVEFDRTGTDVVMYQYRDSDQIERLESCGFVIGHGSFSDISFLSDLGVLGFNVGVDYHKYHSLDAFMNIQGYLSQIAKFIIYYDKFKNVKMPYTYTPSTYHYTSQKYYGSNTWYPVWDEWCQECGEHTDSENYDYDLEMCKKCIVGYGIPICPKCQESVIDHLKEFEDTGLCFMCNMFIRSYGEDTVNEYYEHYFDKDGA